MNILYWPIPQGIHDAVENFGWFMLCMILLLLVFCLFSFIAELIYGIRPEVKAERKAFFEEGVAFFEFHVRAGMPVERIFTSAHASSGNPYFARGVDHAQRIYRINRS